MTSKAAEPAGTLKGVTLAYGLSPRSQIYGGEHCIWGFILALVNGHSIREMHDTTHIGVIGNHPSGWLIF